LLTAFPAGPSPLAIFALSAGVQRLAELAHALAERASQLRQAPGAEHDQGDEREEQQVYGALDADEVRLAT